MLAVLALLAAGLSGTPAAASGAAATTDATTAYAPLPPEPALVPVTATACSTAATAATAACLGQALPVSDAEVARSRESSAASATVAAPLSARSKDGGYTPSDLASLYQIPSGLKPDATVGIVDVGSDPNTEAQMAYFRRSFGLPACTSASGCFREVGADGSKRLPDLDSDWVTEIAIDVQAVSAICPTCHILLVDAPSAGVLDLARATATATRLGARYVSLSFGSSATFSAAAVDDAYYAEPDVTYVAAAGDGGHSQGALFPASAPNVVAAGGTSVRLVNGTWQQSAWSGSGSGCSTQQASELQSGAPFGAACDGKRVVSDLSALADPDTGMLIYRGGSWWSAGGTSLAAPILTALYALAGNHTAPMSIYGARAALTDVTSGSNGRCAPVSLCTAGPGWDGPTGLGTPAGLGALSADGRYITAASARLRGRPGYPAKLTLTLTDAGTGRALPHARVVLERRSDDGGFAPVRQATTGADGSVHFTDRPTSRVTYRVVFPGDVDHRAATSNPVSIGRLRPLVRAGSSPGTIRVMVRAPWGAPVSAMALRLEQRRGGHWVPARAVRTNKHGVATARPRSGGTYRWAYRGDRTWHAWHADVHVR